MIFRNIPPDSYHLGWFRYIFFLNGVVPSEGYFWSNIGITWTIPVFLIFYLLAPLLIKTIKTTWHSALILIASLPVSYLISNRLHGWLSAFVFLPCFLFGIFVYYAKKEHFEFLSSTLLLVFVFSMKWCNWQRHLSKFVQNSDNIVVSALFASLLLLSDRFQINNTTVQKVLSFFDEHSYTLYLVHGITFCGIIDKMDLNVIPNHMIAIVCKLFIAILGTGILTYLTHKFYEKPLQKRLQKRLL